MEKERLINFIGTVMEDSGFKIKKNYKTSNHIIDILGSLNTSVGEVNVVVACKNYEEPWKIGLDVLKDMEIVARAVKASKIVIFTTSTFTHSAAVYAQKRNIKLVDKKGLIKIAKNYSEKSSIITEPSDYEDYSNNTEFYESENSKPASLNPHSQRNSHAVFSGRFKRKDSSSTHTHYTAPSTINTSITRAKKSSKKIKKNKAPSININTGSILEFFKNHTILYLLIVILISTALAYLLGIVSGTGPYTGLGKMLVSALISYGAMILIHRDLSDIMTQGSICFFISIILIVVSLAM